MADAEKKEKKAIVRSSALRREFSNQKKRDRNQQFRSKVRTAVRSLKEAIQSGTDVSSALSQAHSLLDKAAKKGVFKANKSARLKSRLAQQTVSSEKK